MIAGDNGKLELTEEEFELWKFLVRMLFDIRRYGRLHMVELGIMLLMVVQWIFGNDDIWNDWQEHEKTLRAGKGNP